PVQGVPGVENLDVSETVSGHLRYQFLIGRILGLVGLQSVDAQEVAREESALAVKDKKQEQERIQNERRAGVTGDDSAQRVLDNGDGNEEEAMHAEVEQETRDRFSRMDVSEESESQPARPEFKIKRRPLPSEQS
ncbi:hypothetical protein AbraIFM66950_011307, partial [Aspergillus brasiliensis]